MSQCHPERSVCFAKRSSYVVEGPLHGPTLSAKYQGILPEVWAAQRFPARKTRVETGLAPSQTALQSAGRGERLSPRDPTTKPW